MALPTSKEIRYRTYEFWRHAKRNLQNQILTYGKPTEPQDMYKNPFRAARAVGKRSGLEVRLTRFLDSLKVPYTYEEHTIRYQQPAEDHRYTPDVCLINGIILEFKGLFDTADRKKHKLVKAEHPDLDIRFVFSNSKTRISKQSKTTYGMWCETQGIPYADKDIPLSWTQEPTNQKSLDALKKATA